MATEENPSSSEESQKRGLQVDLPTSYATYVDRWAIVVGISKYKHESLNLEYADRDAEELANLLQTPSGGGFEASHIVKLINEDATTANITRALRSFLKKPAREDIVLIYFASHGAPDIDRPNIVYLLTHDTDPRDISGTALPMREVDLSLKENLLAERVIIIADTCHSAALGGGIGRRSAENNSGVVNRYLQEVGTSRGGVALLTSAEANEVSFEDEKWGGGHGVFTHYLLEGMRGAADTKPRNGIVTVGELFEYVRENVQKATGNQQHPCIGSNPFDRNLPIAITAGISAHEHYDLGCHLYQFGLKLDDKYCFQSASRHLQEALRLSRITEENFLETHLQLGLTWLAIGDLFKAVQEFEVATEANVLDAAYYLGIVYAKQNKYEQAIEALRLFEVNQPTDEKIPWVKELLAWLKSSENSNRYALLIGINYDVPIRLNNGFVFKPLHCPKYNTQKLGEVLSKKYRFNVKILSDVEASYEHIIKAFQELKQNTNPDDTVVIYFSGHVLSENSLFYWLAYDAKNEGDDFYNIIRTKDLHELISCIPATNKTIFIDAQTNLQFINLIEKEANYTAFLGTSLSQMVYAKKFKDCEFPISIFTYFLTKKLWQLPANITQEELFAQVKEEVENTIKNQTPLLINCKSKYFIAPEIDYLQLCNFIQRLNYSNLSLDYLNNQYQFIQSKPSVTLPHIYYSFGRAFLEKHDFSKALHAFRSAFQQSKENPSLLFILQYLTVCARQDETEQAVKVFEIFSSTTNKTNINYPNELSEWFKLSGKANRYALLIGIDNYMSFQSNKTSSLFSNLYGSLNNLRILSKVLSEKYSFDVMCLSESEANYENIIEAFVQLNKQVKPNDIVVIYYCGNVLPGNSRDYLCPYDAVVETGKTCNVINVEQLHTLISSIPCLHRTVMVEAQMNLNFMNLVNQQGNYSFFSATSSGEYAYEQKFENEVYGVFTYFLVQQLNECTQDITQGEIFSKVTNEVQKAFHQYQKPYFVCNLSRKIFRPNNLVDKVNQELKIFEQESIKNTIFILKQLIQKRGGADPEGYLNIGIAYYNLGDCDQSIASLEAALNQVSEKNSEVKSKTQAFPEAHYWLGRALCESMRDPAYAVKELRLATQEDPSNATAYYYLGVALRAMVEQQILTEADAAFQTYLKAGSPHGQEEQVQEFLRSRKSISPQ